MTTYYVWTEGGECMDKTDELSEAMQWAWESRLQGAYVTDEDNNVIQAAWEHAVSDFPETFGTAPLSVKVARSQLADSLRCYATPEDVCLSREQFLRTVISRIEDDLRGGTF